VYLRRWISGREFKAVTDSTLEHDVWTVRQLDRAGLRNLVLEDGEKPDEFVERILTKLMLDGAVFELLGGLFMPAELNGKDWTPDMAFETGRLFASATGEDKATVKRQIAGAMEVFLAQGLLSSIRSRRSSVRTVANPPVIKSTAAQVGTADGPR
jgi:hypothetical protein